MPATRPFTIFLKKELMLSLQNISYRYPNGSPLFSNISCSLNAKTAAALVGNNGIGKSTLLKIIAGQLTAQSGHIVCDSEPYYIPQQFGQYDHLTVTQALNIDNKLAALRAILNGEVTDAVLAALNDDWTIEERSLQALASWQLEEISLEQPLSSLSGGQKTRVFLAGIAIHQPSLILMDEPTNHMDDTGRDQLYRFIRNSNATMLIVSHDRTLLNLLSYVYELEQGQITGYGGNYDFYQQQKQMERTALSEHIREQEKSLRKAKDLAREAIERQQKLDAKGKKKQLKEGLPTIAMNTLRNNAEKSTAKLKQVHASKTGDMTSRLTELRKELPDAEQMKLGFENSPLHQGKVLFKATEVNFRYGSNALWQQPVSLQLNSGDRIAIGGLNGSGKTTFINILLGKAEPAEGTVYRAIDKAVYVDQNYSIINPSVTVYEQALSFNDAGLQEHEIKSKLSRFLFEKDDWDKPCSVLSGGERMRLVLCCLTVSSTPPDVIVLDEPTNNLDLQNIEILTAAIKDYKGTLIVVSHDRMFLEQVAIHNTVRLE